MFGDSLSSPHKELLIWFTQRIVRKRWKEMEHVV
jgi:hypothetical protein